MTTTILTVAGVSFTAAKNYKGEYGIAGVEFQKHMQLDDDFTTDLKRGRRPELLLEAGIHSGVTFFNSRDGRATKSFINTKDILALLGVLATRGNKTALAWIIALANETLERRIDAALGTPKTEDDYEASTRSFFRELSRANFIPKLSSWNQTDGANKNYGWFVNEFKTALRLPLSSVDTYSTLHMQRWCEGIVSYNTLRCEGAGHKYALSAVRRQQADI